MGKVSIVKAADNIKQSVHEALALVGGIGLFVKRGGRVLVKPNLNCAEGFTRREVVSALLELLRDYGAGSTIIAESTFGGERMTDLFFRQTGYAELARKHNTPLVNLNRSQAVTVKVAHPLVLETIEVAREAYEADIIINVPNMKVHYATGITLALKNMKGILARDEKRHFHEVGLDKAIADLNNIVKPALNVVDAISCMERMGPRGGDTVNLGLIMAGGAAVEVDYVGCRIMGYAVSEVKHLEYCLKTNPVDLSCIEVVGLQVEAVQYPFKKVQLDKILPPGLHIHNSNACSACGNALLLSCRFLEKAPPGAVDIYLGELPDESVPAQGIKLAFGNCCPANESFAKAIKGCPPYPFALREYLEHPAHGG